MGEALLHRLGRRILADWWDTKGAEMRGMLGGSKAEASPKLVKTGNY